MGCTHLGDLTLVEIENCEEVFKASTTRIDLHIFVRYEFMRCDRKRSQNI